MIVSMLQFILEIPESFSLKDKRKVIKSMKDRVWSRYRVSIAEIDLQDSLRFAQVGVAHVSNSRQHGERIMQKIANFIEDNVPGRFMDLKIFSQHF